MIIYQTHISGMSKNHCSSRIGAFFMLWILYHSNEAEAGRLVKTSFANNETLTYNPETTRCSLAFTSGDGCESYWFAERLLPL